MNQEQFVRNVYPYDAQGNPLVGVQLFDENGNPLNVATFMSEDLDDDGRASIPYPWLNGEKELFNVFPLPEREQPAWRLETLPNAWTSANPPAIPTPPLAAVPPAVLPSAGDGTEVGRTEVDGAGPGAEPAEKQTAGSLRGGDSSAGAADGRRDRR